MQIQKCMCEFTVLFHLVTPDLWLVQCNGNKYDTEEPLMSVRKQM